MNKEEIISSIQEQNPSAGEDFLHSFQVHSLQTYLDRLTRLNGQRGRDSVWIRRTGGSHAAAAKL